MHELGVKLFRLELVWAFVAPSMPGGATYDSNLARNPNWSGYHWQTWDTIVQLASAAGIQLVPQVVYTPDWASGIPTSTAGGPNDPPQSAQFYGDFVSAVVTRYRRQIHFWELWNEPDLAAHTWNGSAQQYVDRVLKPGYQAVKQVDPTARVLLGGLASEGAITQIYAAGGGPYFDIANFHAYDTFASDLLPAINHLQALMQAHGDGQRPIWLTEFGTKTQPDGAPGNPGTITTPNNEGVQAQLIQSIYGIGQLQAIFFYQLHDTAVTVSGGEILKVEYYGLVSRDLTHRKLGFEALNEVTGGALPALTPQASDAPGNILAAMP
jgi:hypothetical protein